MRVRNVNVIQRQIRAVREARRAAARRGLVKVSLLIKRYSQLIVPVDTGNLKGSADTSIEAVRLRARVFYTASYAVFVHENLVARHSPGQEAKFLTRAAFRNLDHLQIVFKKELDNAI